MDRPFSQRVAHDDWQADVRAWVTEQLAAHGHELTGRLQVLRVRPWSTQWAVPTAAGRVWFKANCAALAFEPRLQVELARLAPESVDRPIAIEAERGWMLSLDHGPTLADADQITAGDWQRVITEAASLQQTAADHRVDLLAAGLPDCGPETVPDRFDRLVEILSGLPAADPSHLPPHLRSRLLAQRSWICAAAQQLAESLLPTTWQHGDLHPNNVFARDGRVFDFADGQWANAVEILNVPYGWIANADPRVWPQVLEAYCDSWDVPVSEMESLFAASALTQAINRTMLWWMCLQDATATEWAEWGSAPLHHLTRILDP